MKKRWKPYDLWISIEKEKDCRILLIANKLIENKVVILLMCSSWKTKKTDGYELTRWKGKKKRRSLTMLLTVRTITRRPSLIRLNSSDSTGTANDCPYAKVVIVIWQFNIRQDKEKNIRSTIYDNELSVLIFSFPAEENSNWSSTS